MAKLPASKSGFVEYFNLHSPFKGIPGQAGMVTDVTSYEMPVPQVPHVPHVLHVLHNPTNPKTQNPEQLS